MIQVSNSIVYTTQPKLYKLRRVNSNPTVFFECSTILDGETINDFEEIRNTEIPNIINTIIEKANSLPSKFAQKSIKCQYDVFKSLKHMAQHKILDITLKGDNDFIFKEGNNTITVPPGKTRYIKLYEGTVPQVSILNNASAKTELVRVDYQPNGFNYSMTVQPSIPLSNLEYMCVFQAGVTGYTLPASTNLQTLEGIFPRVTMSNLTWSLMNIGLTGTFPAADFNFIGSKLLQNMFWNASKITDFGGLEAYWDTSSITFMGGMFAGCTSLTSLDVSNWDVSNVTNMSGMFNNCAKLTSLDVSKWDTSNVTNMASMFGGCTRLTLLDVSNWDTSNVTSLFCTFKNLGSTNAAVTNLDVSNWDVSSVTNMGSTFYGVPVSYIDVSNWDTSNVTDMSYMFYACNKLITLNVSNWDVSNVTTMQAIFNNCSGLTSLDVSKWNTSNVTNMVNMFCGCSKLTTLDVSNWDVSNVTNMASMFSNCRVLSSEIDMSSRDISKVTNMSSMFNATSITKVDFSNSDLTACTNFQSFAVNSNSLKIIDLTNTILPNLTNVREMLNGYCSIEQILGILDFSNVTNALNFYVGQTGNLRRLHISNLGKNSSLTSIMIKARYWGVNTNEILDADQSLQDTIDDSYDRATAGYSTCTITLHSNTKTTVLTESQIAAWTAKGFTLA